MVKSDKTKNSKLNTAQQRNENENAAISDTRCENDYYNCDRGSNGFLGASGDGGTGTTLRGGIQWEEIGRGHGGDSNSDWTSQHNDCDVSRTVFEAIEDVAGASVGGSIGNRNSSDGIDHSGFQGGHGVNRLPEPAERSSGVASLAGSSVERSTSARARTSSEIEASAPAMKRRKVRTREESLLRRNCNNSAGGARNAIVVDELDDRKPAATPSSSKSSVQHSSNRNNNSNDTPRKTSRKSSSSNTICKIRDNNGGSSSNLKRKEFAPSLVEYLRPGGFKKYAPRPEWCHFSTTTALTSDSENQGLNAVGTGVTSANSGEASASGEVIGGSHGNGGLQNGERITGLSTFHYSSPSDSVPMNTYGLPTLPPGFFTNGGLTGLTFSRSPVGGPSDVNVDATVGITNGNNNNNHNLAHLGNVLAISNIDGRNREMIEFFARDLNQSIDAFLTGQRQEQQQLQMQPMMQEQEQQLHQNEQDQQQQVAGVVAAGAGAGGGGGDGDGEGEGQGDNGWNNNGDDGGRNNNRNDNDMDNSNEAVNENDLLDENEDRNAEVAPNANDILAAAAMPQNYDENQPPPQLRGQHDIENLYPILNNLNNISNRTIQQMSIAMMAGMETTSIVPERRDNALVALLNAAGVSEAESEAISAQAIAAAEAEIRAQREERHNRRANNNNNNNNNINGNHNGQNFNAAVYDNAGNEHHHDHNGFDADGSLAGRDRNRPDIGNLARVADQGQPPPPQQDRRHRGRRLNVHDGDANEQHQQQQQDQHILMNPQNLAPIAAVLGDANNALGAQGGVAFNFNEVGQFAEPHVVRVLERAVNWWMWRRQQQQLQQNVAAMGSEGRGGQVADRRDAGEALLQFNRSTDASGIEAMLAPPSIPNKVAVFGTEYDTALHLAIKEHATDAALDLIQSGACVHFPNARGVTPLILASQKGNIAVVRELLRKGAMPNASTITGSTAFIQACHFGRLSVVEELVRFGAKVEQANYKNTTALMRASQEGHEEVVRFLLKHNASVNRRNDEKMTALMLSSQRGHAGIVKMLIRAGAEVDAKTAQESTSLMLACKRRHLSVAKILVAHGTELMLKDSKGSTVLETAIRKGRTEFAKILTGAAQLRLMKKEIRRERSFEIVRIWTLLQWERAHICVNASNVTIHKVTENKSDPLLTQLSNSDRALVLAMSLPAPQIELIASFIPLPRVWENRMKLLTSRCHVHPDTGVFGTLDLIDEVLEEGGLLEAFDTARVNPPPSFASWSDFGAWCRHCDVILSESDGGAGSKENQYMLDAFGILRKVGSSLNQRRRANYLTVLAYAPSALRTSCCALHTICLRNF